MLRAANTSRPRFAKQDLSDFITGERGEDKVEIQNGVQEVVLGYFDTEELKQIFDKSSTTVQKYRQGRGKYVPREGFRQAFEQMNEDLEGSVNTEFDLVDINSANSISEGNGTLIEGLDQGDLEKGERLYGLLSILEGDRRITRALAGVSALENIRGSTYSKSRSINEGHLYTLLRDAGYLEKWGGGGSSSTHRKIASDEEFDVVEAALQKHLEEEREEMVSYEDDELFSIVEEAAAELGETPSKDYLDSSYEPSHFVFENRFGSYNNLLFRADLEPNTEFYDREELEDILITEFVRNGLQPPTKEAIDAEENYPNSRTFIRKYGSMDEALESAGIPVLEDTSEWWVPHETEGYYSRAWTD